MKPLNLPERVNAELERLGAIAPRLGLSGPVLVAVSGGRDSVSLLHLTHRIGLQIEVAHLDHGIREDSSQDAVFVRDLCASLPVPFHTDRVDVPAIAQKRGWSLEEAARKLRYDFLTRTARSLDARAILTAHTQIDDAETVVMHLLRGTARATGIPSRRDRILRPLLTTARAELEAFLREHNLTWRDDPTNLDTTFTRNWVRLEIMPLLAVRYPNAIQSLARYAVLSRDEDALLEELADLVPPWASWRSEPAPVQRRLIRRLLEAARIRADFGHIEVLREALENASKAVRMSLSDGHTGLVQDGRVSIFDREHRLENPTPDLVFRPLEMPDDLDFRPFPTAKLRTWKPGDRIRLPGGKRKLSDVLADRRIPREMRQRVPVVAQHSEVLWIGLEPPITDVRIAQPHDTEWSAMGEALKLAQDAFEDGEVPVGAVVLRGQEIVGCGRNRSRALGDMTRHAELEAIRDATQRLGTPYLSDCRLIVTLEPCGMCLGASLESRVARIVYGATNDKSGALGGVAGSLRAPWVTLHTLTVRSHVREKECSALLTAFFGRVRRDRADPLEKP